MTSSPPLSDRPLGFWLHAVDALLHRAFADALADEDVSRREWMLLNAVDAPETLPWLAERLARRSGRVRRLRDRGWIAEAADGWTLTDDGRAAKERLDGLVDGIRQRVAGAVSPEDFAVTLASLEAIATELGGVDDLPRGRRRHGHHGHHGHRRRFGDAAGVGHPHDDGPHHGHGFGPHRGHGAGRRHGHGFGPHRGHGFAPHGEGHCCDRHGHAGPAPEDDTAFERGFTAGFAQGRAAASAPSAS